MSAPQENINASQPVNNRRLRPGRHVLAAAVSCCIALAANACTDTPSHGEDESIRTDVFVTAYTWFDNTPPGSTVISHPMLHKAAGGTGTYADPVGIHAKAGRMFWTFLPAPASTCRTSAATSSWRTRAETDQNRRTDPVTRGPKNTEVRRYGSTCGLGARANRNHSCATVPARRQESLRPSSTRRTTTRWRPATA